MAVPDRPPRRRLPGVSRRFLRGAWRWRAVRRCDGRQIVGPYRDTQEEAYDDWRDLAAADGELQLPRRIVTLSQALHEVCRQAEARGVAAGTLVAYRRHADYLLRAFDGRTPLSGIGKAELLAFVRLARGGVWVTGADGLPRRATPRHVNTIAQKDLPLLSQAFRVAGLPDPVARLGRHERPGYVPPQMAWLELGEIVDLVRRMRTEFPQVRQRERHADLIMLFALSGVRSGEFGRVRVADVDLRRRKILIREPKVRRLVRELEVVDQLVPVIERLVATAHARGTELLVPGGASTISTVCKRWGARLGEPRLNNRALRHSFGTALLYSGAAIGEVRDLLGHSRLQTTDRYVHAVSSRRKVAVDRVAAAFG